MRVLHENQGTAYAFAKHNLSRNERYSTMKNDSSEKELGLLNHGIWMIEGQRKYISGRFIKVRCFDELREIVHGIA